MKDSNLLQIPGVGKTIAENLIHIGCPTIASLRGKDPEELYAKDCAWKGFQEDRCLLYVFRLAVYYAENETHDPEKLKWWNWKDRT
nr:helix-hairpin-helix domain-containing protein [Clostridium sp. D33t1_170424_F3]